MFYIYLDLWNPMDEYCTFITSMLNVFTLMWYEGNFESVRTFGQLYAFLIDIDNSIY